MKENTKLTKEAVKESLPLQMAQFSVEYFQIIYLFMDDISGNRNLKIRFNTEFFSGQMVGFMKGNGTRRDEMGKANIGYFKHIF
jgi:hypothetical protein